MITVIEGRGVGAGKTYYVIETLIQHWVLGGTACVSDSVAVKWEACKAYVKRRYGLLLQDSQYRKIAYDDLTRLHEVTPAGSRELPVLLVVDEAQQAFNARDWNDKGKRAFFDWLCHSRHDCNDVLIVSQASANVDKQVRRLATFFFVVRNSEFFPILGVSMQRWLQYFTLFLHHGRVFVRTQLDQDGHTQLGRKWVLAEKAIFDCYESLAMRLLHRRAGEVARLRLQQDKRGLGMKGLILVSLIVAIFSGCTLYRYVQGNRSKRAAAVSAVVVNSSGYQDGDTLLEGMRAQMEGYLQTAKRVYRVGERNDLGMTLAVGQGAAVVQVTPQVRVTIRTFTERDSGPVGEQASNSGKAGPLFSINSASKK